MGYITFNNITTNKDAQGGVSKIEGVVVQTPPIYEFPSRRSETIQIQGKNGDLIFDKNSYNNTKREYNIGIIIKEDETFSDKVREIINWLTSATGYARLEDSYDEDYFRFAVYRSGGQFPNIYDKVTTINIGFECKPQRFLKTGENIQILLLDTWLYLNNETNFIALPEIFVNGTNVVVEVQHKIGEDWIETSKVTISGVTGDCKIDSEIQDCYNNVQFLNNETTILKEFPKLYPGENRVKITGITSSNIKPRWWVL